MHVGMQSGKRHTPPPRQCHPHDSSSGSKRANEASEQAQPPSAKSLKTHKVPLADLGLFVEICAGTAQMSMCFHQAGFDDSLRAAGKARSKANWRWGSPRSTTAAWHGLVGGR